MKSKAARAAYSPVEGSTSTPAESTSSTTAGKKSRPAKTASFEVAFPDWFAQFEEAGEKGKMGGEGIEKLFGEMDLSMEGVRRLAQRFPMPRTVTLTAPRCPCRRTRSSWPGRSMPSPGALARSTPRNLSPSSACKGTHAASSPSSLRLVLNLCPLSDSIDSSDKLKSFLIKSEKSVMTPHESAVEAKTSPDALAFRQFYTFLFPFLRPEGAKTVPAEMAIAMWSVVLAPKFELAKRFVEYATVRSWVSSGSLASR